MRVEQKTAEDLALRFFASQCAAPPGDEWVVTRSEFMTQYGIWFVRIGGRKFLTTGSILDAIAGPRGVAVSAKDGTPTIVPNTGPLEDALASVGIMKERDER